MHYLVKGEGLEDRGGPCPGGGTSAGTTLMGGGTSAGTTLRGGAAVGKLGRGGGDRGAGGEDIDELKVSELREQLSLALLEYLKLRAQNLGQDKKIPLVVVCVWGIELCLNLFVHADLSAFANIATKNFLVGTKLPTGGSALVPSAGASKQPVIQNFMANKKPSPLTTAQPPPPPNTGAAGSSPTKHEKLVRSLLQFFLNSAASVPDCAPTVYQLLLSYGCAAEFIYFATKIRDFSVVATHLLNRGEFNQLLNLLEGLEEKNTRAELLREYAALLFVNEPVKLVDLLLKLPSDWACGGGAGGGRGSGLVLGGGAAVLGGGLGGGGGGGPPLGGGGTAESVVAGALAPSLQAIFATFCCAAKRDAVVHRAEAIRYLEFLLRAEGRGAEADPSERAGSAGAIHPPGGVSSQTVRQQQQRQILNLLVFFYAGGEKDEDALLSLLQTHEDKLDVPFCLRVCLEEGRTRAAVLFML